MTDRWTRSALLLAGVALVATVLAGAAAARVDAGFGRSASKSVNVAFIYPKTGGLAAFGAEEYDGFQAGLAYTKGQCGGYTINPTYIDDATDAATAINAFKSEVGQGLKIIAGTGRPASRPLAPLAAQNKVLFISGPAATDAITGSTATPSAPAARRYQDVLAAANSSCAKSVGQEDPRLRAGHGFGAGQRRRGEGRLRRQGHTVSLDPRPPSARPTSRRSPSRLQRRSPTCSSSPGRARPPAAMWQALQQQGVSRQRRRSSPAWPSAASYGALGPPSGRQVPLALRLRRRRTR